MGTATASQAPNSFGTKTQPSPKGPAGTRASLANNMAEPCLADLTNQTGALGASHQQPAFCPTALPDALGTAYTLFAAERANLVARTQHAGSTIAAAVVQLQQKPVQVAAAKQAPASQGATSKQRSLDSLNATNLRRRDAALARKLQVAIGTRKPLAKVGGPVLSCV